MPSPLTRREREVAALVARGQTDRQIAEALVITEGTVGVHLANIFTKLDLQLARPARRLGRRARATGNATRLEGTGPRGNRPIANVIDPARALPAHIYDVEIRRSSGAPLDGVAVPW